MPEGVASMINVKLTIKVPMGLFAVHLEKTVVAGAVYLQEGDSYELWNGGPTAEVSGVMWAHDFQRVRVWLQNDGVDAEDARNNGWTVRGQATGRTPEKPHTWRTVPLGTLVPGRGYVVSKGLQKDGVSIHVEFAPDDSAIFKDRYGLMLVVDEEVSSATGN